MEKLSHSAHAKLQEMCDCYTDTDFLKQLHAMQTAKSTDPEEDATKYLALAILYALTEKASKLAIKKKEGKVSVTVSAEDKIEIPPPPAEVSGAVFSLVRSITHIEGEQGETPLALGLRSGQIELQVKLKKKPDKETIKFTFPELGE